jgi:hypothetical protein
MRKILLLAALLGGPTAVVAQPPEVLAFHQSMGGGDLLLSFCLIGEHICVERRAVAFGQVCDSSLAKSIGSGESGDYVGIVPFGFSYAGFRCGEGHRWHPQTDKVFGGGNWMN